MESTWCETHDVRTYIIYGTHFNYYDPCSWFYVGKFIQDYKDIRQCNVI